MREPCAHGARAAIAPQFLRLGLCYVWPLGNGCGASGGVVLLTLQSAMAGSGSEVVGRKPEEASSQSGTLCAHRGACLLKWATRSWHRNDSSLGAIAAPSGVARCCRGVTRVTLRCVRDHLSHQQRRRSPPRCVNAHAVPVLEPGVGGNLPATSPLVGIGIGATVRSLSLWRHH
jgi:hypothetical protein